VASCFHALDCSMRAIEPSMLQKLARHFLVLKFRRTGPGTAVEEGCLGAASCFVLHAGGWFLVTAAHVINDVKLALSQGVRFDSWALHDEAAGHQFKFGVPIAFDPEEWWFANDEAAGLDYAALPLSELAAKALQAGGVVPLSAAAWRNALAEEFRAHLLLGMPSESVSLTGTGMSGRLVMLPLMICAPPTGCDNRIENMFFAKIRDNDSPDVQTVRNIEGMSGGPIFGIRLIDGVEKYSAIGIQSGWWSDSRIVSCCRLEGFARALHDHATNLG
jgi:hypothetical protein